MSDTPNPPQEPIQPTPPAATSTPPGTPAGPAGTPDNQSLPPGMGDPADVEKNKVMALLSYISILWLVPLLAAKDSPFAKYHCNQGILLTIGAFGLGFGLMIVSLVVSFIPIIHLVALCLSCVIWPLLMLALLGYAIMGILNALGGKMKPLPLFPVVNWVK